MYKEEFMANCDMRWGILKRKKETYGEAWREYHIETLLKLAIDRMSEVGMVYNDTGEIDRDNLIDTMNFLDMVLIRMGEL